VLSVYLARRLKGPLGGAFAFEHACPFARTYGPGMDIRSPQADFFLWISWDYRSKRPISPWRLCRADSKTKKQTSLNTILAK
jgi:hypothetical protein